MDGVYVLKQGEQEWQSAHEFYLHTGFSICRHLYQAPNHVPQQRHTVAVQQTENQRRNPLNIFPAAFREELILVSSPFQARIQDFGQVAQKWFNPRGGPWAQTLLNIGAFPLKFPQNCMIVKTILGQGGARPLDPHIQNKWLQHAFCVTWATEGFRQRVWSSLRPSHPRTATSADSLPTWKK